MGTILSRFRKKKSTSEVLEHLEQEIKRLHQFKRQNQERQKWFIAKLLLYSILIYIVSALVFYFYYFPDNWKERLLYSLPLLLFPFIIWLVKKTLHWYFVKRIAKNDIALEELREKKKQILEDVMEKETYKKAREILEKFDPARFKELETPKPAMAKPTPGTDLRQRQFATRSPPGSQLRPGLTPGFPARTPLRPPSQQRSAQMQGSTPYGPRGSAQGIRPRNIMSPQQPNGTPQGPQLARPILPRERGAMDRVLEYLVGDGPQNRYALICANCSSHNGMALREEFEYISFRCCYCYAANPARKRRPYAPRIEPPPPPPGQSTASTSSQEEEKTDSADDSEDDDEEDATEGIDKQASLSGATGGQQSLPGATSGQQSLPGATGGQQSLPGATGSQQSLPGATGQQSAMTTDKTTTKKDSDCDAEQKADVKHQAMAEQYGVSQENDSVGDSKDNHISATGSAENETGIGSSQGAAANQEEAMEVETGDAKLAEMVK